jgi:hypothetical protein
MLPIPGGFNFELTEFTNTPTRTLGQQPAISDPGAPHEVGARYRADHGRREEDGLAIITTSSAGP